VVGMQSFGLHQHTIEFNGPQQLAQGLDLDTGICGVGGLGDRHASYRLEPVAPGWVSVNPGRLTGGDARHHGAAGNGAATANPEDMLRL